MADDEGETFIRKFRGETYKGNGQFKVRGN
jgi:hypothetical protein